MARSTLLAALGVATLALAHGTHAAQEVEVLHWWTSGGEARSVAELKKMLEAKGYKWKDFAVAGGGGENAMTVLKSRVVSGNPPTAAQIKGPSIQEWGRENVLANLDDVAKAGRWDSLLPPVVASVMKYQGHYVAAPVNVHRVNWMWVNPAVFKKAGAKVPATWDEFAVACEKIHKARLIAVAHGGQPWQDSTVFESVALGVGGADYYRKAFVQLDQAALSGPITEKAFAVLRSIQKCTDKDAPGRDWNLATAMVIQGKAGMQFMGDWAKGEFRAAGKQPGKDYLCIPAPGTKGAYTFNIDSFVMFEQSNAGAQAGQRALAEAIMSPEFQEIFNLNKGSIPVRAGVSLAKFDQCAKDSASEFQEASKNNTLVPSWAHGMAIPSSTQGALFDVVTQFFNDPSMSAKSASQKLAQAAMTK